ncbi:MAG: zinc-dependent metalloprotease, partial [Algicola sp.]|nr:zinc-dependent metalloprotease [Algicola sp.]
GSKPGEYVRQVAPDPYSLTVHMHHSFIKLPDDNYIPRAFSPNSGMMPYEVKDYASAIDAPMEKRFIPRHRLQKKNKNAAVSAPIKPIIYYLDPGVPEPVKGALLDGASWWNEAFEAIGYKNAYQVKILPVDADPMDVRYNVIQWVHRATRGWSYGSSVVDPRTGEIIKGHVTLGSLRVRQDLLIAQGMTSAFDGHPQKLAAAKNMALDRIRQLSAHEVGHTLGIAHNFAASASNRASVMDYPHPLITMDNNGDIVLNDGYDKGIGDWDKFVVAYGYSEFTGDEKAQLAQIQAQAKAKGLMFISDEDARPIGGAHPAAHLWDNGKDPVDELNRLIEVRSKALAKFGLNSLAKGVSLSQLQEKLVPIYLFHRYQTQAAVKLIAGVDYSYELKSKGRAQGSTVVAPNRQKAALNAILATLDSDFLTLPETTLKLILPKAYGEYRNRESFKSRTGLTFDAVSIAEVAARHSISLLLHPQRLNRLHQQTNNIRVGQVIEGLFKHSIKASQRSGLAGQVQQRVANVVVELMMQQLQSDKISPEVKAVFYDKIISLAAWIETHGGNALLAQQIKWFEETGKWQPQIKLLPLPPGSPI